MSILTMADYIKLLNCLFVRDVIAQSTISPLKEFFTQMRDTHERNTRHASQNKHHLVLIWNQIKNTRYEVREYITNKLISKIKTIITTMINLVIYYITKSK